MADLTAAQRNALEHYAAKADSKSRPESKSHTVATLNMLVRMKLMTRGESHIVDGMDFGKPYLITDAGRAALGAAK